MCKNRTVRLSRCESSHPIWNLRTCAANLQNASRRPKGLWAPMPLTRCKCEFATFAARCISDDACDLACCRACAVTREPMPQRYHNNVYHQAELAYSIIEAELTRPASADSVPLHSVYWRLPLMNWTAAMLQLMLPSVRVVVGSALGSASVPPDCAVIKGSQSAGAYFRKAESAGVLRSAAHARCGLDLRRASQACCQHSRTTHTSHLAPRARSRPPPPPLRATAAAHRARDATCGRRAAIRKLAQLRRST